MGVVAYSDGDRELVISINPAKNTWEYRIAPGRSKPKKFKLPKELQLLQGPPRSGGDSAPLHRLRITKNGGYFDVMLDHIKLTANKPIITPLTGAGVPGLYCRASTADFDGVSYTVGWDEHDAHITGWGSAEDGSPAGGEWQHRKTFGLEQKQRLEKGRAFKGDLLEQYEFTVNARTEKLEEDEGCLYGVLPVFADKKNYLKAMIDTHRRELIVSGMRDGRQVGPFSVPLKRQISCRHLYDKDTYYQNIAAWIYPLRSLSIISALDVRWLEGRYDHLQQEFFIPFADLFIRYANLRRRGLPYMREGDFYDADTVKVLPQRSGILNPIPIRPAPGNHVGLGFYPFSVSVLGRETPSGSGELIRYNAVGHSESYARPQETLVTVDVESSYFFRCVKLKDRVVIELNGKPMLTVDGAWPASQVGLFTEGQACFFDGITLMHLPTEPAK